MLLLTLAGFVCLLLKGAQLKRLRSGMRRPRALAQRAWHQIDAWSWCGVVLLLTGGEVIRQWRGGAVMESLPSGGGWWMLPQLLIQAVIAGGVLTVGLARCGSWRRAFGRIIPRGDFKAAVLTLLALLPVALVLMP